MQSIDIQYNWTLDVKRVIHEEQIRSVILTLVILRSVKYIQIVKLLFLFIYYHIYFMCVCVGGGGGGGG